MSNIFYILSEYTRRWDKSHFSVSIEKEKAYLENMPNYTDDIDRSYCQYLCQNYYKPRWLICFLNIFSFVAFPFVVLGLLIKGLMIRHIDSDFDALSNMEGFKDVIPISLISEYKINFDNWYKGMGISMHDIPFICKLACKHPFSPYFTLKNVIKMSYYHYMICRFSIKAIITYDEYAFTSSISTYYCERYGVKHINVMHGEKVYYIRDSFFRFHRCYVWNEYYKKLLLSLHAEESQFIIELPPMLKLNVGKYYSKSDYSDYKYYLAIYTKEQLDSIIKSMSVLVSKGYTIKLRPHPNPLYSNLPLLEKMVDKSLIEYPSKVSILTSVASMHGAIGAYSTVLNQAYYAGKEVILDDITYLDEVSKLKSRQYILLSETPNACHTLSELIK